MAVHINEKSKLDLHHDVLSALPESISSPIKKISLDYLEKLEEIRIRINRPLMVVIAGSDYFLSD
ncbi:MAG: hypothetical protein RSB66_05675, partial [Clostridium sp.]